MVSCSHKEQLHVWLQGLGGDLGEKVSLNWLTSPSFELREKFKCMEWTEKSIIIPKTFP